MSYPDLRITFLGTGTSGGVPMIACSCRVCTSTNIKDKRLRSSILVQSKTTTLVVDTTPDFRTQMLREDVKKLDAVIFTHPHKDHIAGLDDIKAYNYFQQKTMEVYANTLTQEALRREFHYIFEKDKYPGIPSVNLNTISDKTFMVGDIPVTPILVFHSNMPVLGFRFGDFTYITDANRIDKVEKEKIRGSKVLVLNALRKTEHISHFSLGEAIGIVEELEIPNAWFTHISHQLGLHEEINNELNPGMKLAWDGLKLNV
ncbi:MAG: MBL fold metallo-hydrolase [Bacteroidota bacterium]|nr:MBL fold metallo-hydrolase [Bacteroidota bacterium]